MNKKIIKLINIFLSIIILSQFILPYYFNSFSYAAGSSEDIYDVILFWGQSNMQGCCTPVIETRYNPKDSSSISDYSARSMIDADILSCLGSINGQYIRNYMAIPQVSNTAFEYVYTENALKEINSSTWALGEDLMVTSSGSLVTTDNTDYKALYSSFGTNMIPEFCRTYYQKTGHKVVVVFAANPGKEIRNFLPYDDADNTVDYSLKICKIYEAIQEKYTSAIKYLNSHNYKIGLQAHVVFQGETDMGSYHTDYEAMFMKLHNYFKGLGIQKGVVVETSMAAGSMLMSQINLFKTQQDSLIANHSDIILGSSFPYDRYVPPQTDYANCNTKITYSSSGSKLSYAEAFQRATLSEDYGGENALHYSSAGLSQVGRDCANNLAAALDSTPPVLSTSYSTTLLTNQNVTATIKANEEIQSVSGWTLSNDKKSLSKIFTANGSEQVTVYDTFGNSSKISVLVANIDKVAPTASVTYSTSESTNQNVTATITANEEIKSVNGWTLSNDSKKLTKVFSANASEQVTVYDLAGNSKSVSVNVSNIDKSAPSATVSYSTTLLTNQDVTATITANKEINPVDGWTLSSDKKTLTKTFPENVSGQVTISDSIGNSANITVQISNIDKVAPNASISYSTSELTNESVIATITSSEELKPLNGWTRSSNGKTFTKTYLSNSTEQITVYDLAGNSAIINLQISNIDNDVPFPSVSYSTTLMTNQDVTAYITSSKELKPVDGWNLSSDQKVLSKTFSENDSSIVTVSDLAGNNNIVYVEVANIDRDAPRTSVRYDITDSTNSDVTVTILASEAIQSLEGWTLSEDHTSLTKTYNQNTTEQVTIYDLAGNSSTADVEISNIDKTAPSVNINYSTTEPTNSDVIVTITSNKALQEVSGWTLSYDNKTLTKVFSSNGTESLELIDMYGNTIQAVNINVSNIDKISPSLDINYSTSQLTNEDVTVTITSDEIINQLESWNISNNRKELTKKYSSNNAETVTIYDISGNSSTVNVNVDNIDKTAPTANITYDTSNGSGFLVTIEANEPLRELEGWSLSNDKKTLSKNYSSSVMENITIYDIVGNPSNLRIYFENKNNDISQDTEAPQATVQYNSKAPTNRFCYCDYYIK